MAEPTIGEQLIALRQRAGVTLDEVAGAMKLKGRSSVQRFFVPHLERLSFDDALKLADAFEGKGEPPITRQEVVQLSGVAALFDARPSGDPIVRPMTLDRDVPVYGMAMGTYKEGGEGQEIEQAFIDASDVVEHLARPPGYANRKGLYALYVYGSSMEPRWDAGDPLYVDPKRPASIGDDVVVYLAQPSGEDRELEGVLIKRLVRRSGSYIELEQYNPSLTFRVETRRISAIHRVIPRRELLSFH